MWAKLHMEHVPSLCVLCSPCYSVSAMAKFWPLHHCDMYSDYSQRMGENRRKKNTYKHMHARSCIACGRGGMSIRYFHQIKSRLGKLYMKHFPSLRIYALYPLYTYACMYMSMP